MRYAHKFSRYEPAIRTRLGWHVLFVVETAARAAWLARVAREPAYPGLAGRAWAIVLGDLKTAGVEAPAVSLEARGGRSTLGAIVRDPRPAAVRDPGRQRRLARAPGLRRR